MLLPLFYSGEGTNAPPPLHSGEGAGGEVNMPALERPLRALLENTVKRAREVAEKAAISALAQIGVSQASPDAFLTAEQKELRNKLRAHGRSLGDVRAESGTQSCDILQEEVAYQFWHRMIFARFLAENNLLMVDVGGTYVPVTLDDCNELAESEGAENGWELAARYAARMLPQIFPVDSPIFGLRLSPEALHELESLLSALPAEVFIATDSLGWIYQYWQSKRKDDINKSEVKIGARELPAVTQLFTEPYMVQFLLDNHLGAMWANQCLTPEDVQNPQSEDELRQKAAIDGVPLTYLRFPPLHSGEGSQGGEVSLPLSTVERGQGGEVLKHFTLLDPCCGSGHFLVAALHYLVPMRMALEHLSARDAVDAVLRDNIHGLELDDRCVKIAAFALALAAWTYPEAGGYRELPRLNIACSGRSPAASRDEWRALGKSKTQYLFGWLYDAFQKAPTLGSLIDPQKFKDAVYVDWNAFTTDLDEALARETDDNAHEMAISARGLAFAARLLTQKYDAIYTNVPYLSAGKQDEVLRKFCAEKYPDAKGDIANVFLERCLELCKPGGTANVVMPQNWLFLKSYKKEREKLLKNYTFNLIAKLGDGAFQTPMWSFNVQLISITNQRPVVADGLFNLTPPAPLPTVGRGEGEPAVRLAGERGEVKGLDVSAFNTPQDKANALRTQPIQLANQAKQLQNPDARITLEDGEDIELLNVKCECFAGILNGDTPRFIKQYWEVTDYLDLWSFQQTTVDENIYFGGLSQIIYYDFKEGHLREDATIRRVRLHNSDERGNQAWNKWGIGISQMRILPASLYIGNTFDSNIAVIYPKNQELVPALWCYCSSPEYNENVRKIDQKLNVTNATLVKVPFDLARWQKVAEEKYPHGLPKPFSDDPTQWIFHGHPCASVVWNDDKKWTDIGPLRTDSSVLQVAVARLLGYRWPGETSPLTSASHTAGTPSPLPTVGRGKGEFPTPQGKISPPLSTVERGPGCVVEVCDESRQILQKLSQFDDLVDDDGIVCIPAVHGEQPAADRLLRVLTRAYGDQWTHATLEILLTNSDSEGKTLESWLRDGFFKQHCAMFGHRPFIWQIWDGTKDGFSVLINYHKFTRKALESLIYTYLGDWIAQQQRQVEVKTPGAQNRLDAAVMLQNRLKLILVGDAPYDIFVRWKPLSKQPIGWNPDLNDGVRLNIRPFMTGPDIKKAGAGILRDKTNIKWDKDRGKDVESSPWYELFHGDRINDHHLSLKEKGESHGR